MKKYVLLFLILFVCTYTFGQLGYRYGSSFIELYPDSSSLYFVQTRNAEQMMKIKERVLNDKEGAKIIANLADNACIVNKKTIGAGHYISDIYNDKDGHKLIMLPRFAVKMKVGYEINELLTLYGKYLSFDKKELDLFMFNCNFNNSVDVLNINEKINLLESVEWCEPMMIGEVQKFNELYGNQYYIKNTGQNGGISGIDINVEPVWNYLTPNTSINVAVLDDGVERNHEDLIGSVLDGKTIDYPNELGDPINEYLYWGGYYYGKTKSHGTACAGIIAAHNNSIGIRGVASGVNILPINIYPYSVPLTIQFDYPNQFQYEIEWYEKIGQAITWAVDTIGVDVISCSCGWSHSSYISNALSNAMVNGRNGKGTVVVCASGNTIPSSDVKFPANMANTIAVGAVDKSGNIWDYSCSGPSLDLVAPSGNIKLTGDVVTTDRMGNLGNNPPVNNGTELTNTNYTQRFGGTSAACPQVAGVVALMLSANPNLTQSEVVSILRNTATKLPGMNGLSRTDAYGYGLVNAHAAVVQAYQFSISGPDEPCGSSVYSVTNLPSGFTVDWSLSPNVTVLNNSILTTNSPQQNQCSIYNDAVLPWATNLCATIKNPSGVTVTTLMKYIRNTFDLTYSQNGSGGYASIPPTAVESDETIAVNCGCFITLTSPVFAGMNITHTGASPFGFSAFGNTVNFQFANGTNNQWMTIRGSDGCKVLKLKVGVTSNPNLPLPMLVVNPVDDGFELLLTYEGDEEAVKSMMARLQDMEWELNITNATSGEKVQSVLVKGPKTTVRTAGWKSGVYVLQAVVDGQECNKKITVK